MKPVALLTAVAVAALLAACGTARRSPPAAPPMAYEATAVANGRQVFLVHCHKCHPGGEGGLGPAINNKPLPGPLIRLQVRKGLGAMPAFPESEISSEELDHLVEYLRALRQNSPEPAAVAAP